MKMNKALPLTLAGALAVVLTACNLNGVPTKTNVEGVVEGTAKPSIGSPTLGAPGSVQTNPNVTISTAKPNASVSGKLLDTNGLAVPNAYVFAANGQVAKTDLNGNYSIAVTAEAGKEVNLIFQKEGYVFSSERVTMAPGDKALVDGSVKKLDPQVVSVEAAKGGTFKNSTGVLEVDVPAGALTGNANMSMTPLNFGQGGLPNELPGPLETVDEQGTRQLLMPAEYWSIDLAGAKLKEGESIVMRMKLPENPNAPVKLKAGDMIPCYIYDAKLGYWNSPNLGPVVEKDGQLWATYEIKASALNDRTDVLSRSVQHIHAGDAKHPLSDDQLRHNAEHLREGANNSFADLATAGGGVIGGHTYFPVFGSIMKVHVEDEKGNPLDDASVSITGGGNPGTAGNAGGANFERLQYRAQNVSVRARLNEFCDVTLQRTTAASNKVKTPLNQYGYWTEDYMEDRSPERADWDKIVVDTRNPLSITFKGEVPDLNTLKFTLVDQATGQELPLTFNSKTKASAVTTKVLDRGHKYTVVGESLTGKGQVEFAVTADYTKGKPVEIGMELVGNVK